MKVENFKEKTKLARRGTADLFVGIFSVRLVYPVRIKMLVQQDIIRYYPGKKQCAAGRLGYPVDKWTDHRKCALILLTMKHDA